MEDATLYAYYEGINYNTNGESIIGNSTYTYFDDSYKLPIPIKKGYIFTGWICSNGNAASTNVKIDSNNQTFTAHEDGNGYLWANQKAVKLKCQIISWILYIKHRKCLK